MQVKRLRLWEQLHFRSRPWLLPSCVCAAATPSPAAGTSTGAPLTFEQPEQRAMLHVDALAEAQGGQGAGNKPRGGRPMTDLGAAMRENYYDENRDDNSGAGAELEPEPERGAGGVEGVCSLPPAAAT